MSKRHKSICGQRRHPLLCLPLIVLLLHCCHYSLAAENKKNRKTEQPTVSPTVFSFPTRLASASPSLAPTPIATASPSVTPSVHNTLNNRVYGALIPIMDFDILLSDDDALLPLTRNMNAFFTMFMDQVLSDNSDGFDFDYSHLETNVLMSSFRHNNNNNNDNDDNRRRQRQRRRQLESGYSVRVDGIAYFFEDAPTRASLLHSLTIYFNFWGVTDLEEYLHRLGMESAKVAFIAIDEKPVKAFEDERFGHGHAGADIATAAVGTKDKGGTSLIRIIAICIYVGAILLIPTAALGVLLYGRRKRQRNAKKESFWKSKEPSALGSETSKSAMSPHTTNSLQHEQSEESRSLSSAQLMLDDLSVYATNDGAADNEIVFGNYDEEATDQSSLVTGRF